MKKALALCALLIITLLLYVQFGNQPEPIDTDSESGRRMAGGPYQVIREELTLVDVSRPTAAHGDVPASDVRTLTTSRWRPERSIPAQPLLLYSHGFMSSRDEGTHLAEHLASHGYMVVAVDFPLTSYQATRTLQARDVVNQPGDISFLLSELLMANRDPGNPLFGTIDPLRIAALGYSLGGLTTELLAFHPQLGDTRISLAAVIAAPSVMLTRQFFSYRALPFLMVATPTDAMVNYQQNAAGILDKVPGSILATIDHGSHAGFNYQSRPLRFMRNPDQIGCWALAFSGDEQEQEDNWYQALGTEEQGISQEGDIAVCSERPLPATINPITQQALATLVVSAFLQCNLAPNVDDRRRHCDYLKDTAAVELDGLEVATSARPL